MARLNLTRIQEAIDLETLNSAKWVWVQVEPFQHSDPMNLLQALAVLETGGYQVQIGELLKSLVKSGRWESQDGQFQLYPEAGTEYRKSL